MTLSPDEARTLCTSFLDVLVELHGVDADAAGLGDLGQGPRLRRPPGRRLVGPLPEGAHRQRRRLRGDHGLARRAAAGRRRDLRDPQRLPARQRGARPARTRCASAACSTGRWPPSATRSWTSAARWPTGSRPTTTSTSSSSAGSRPTSRGCSPAGRWSSTTRRGPDGRSPASSGRSTRSSACSGSRSSPSRSTTGSTTARPPTRPTPGSCRSCSTSSTGAPR